MFVLVLYMYNVSELSAVTFCVSVTPRFEHINLRLSVVVGPVLNIEAGFRGLDTERNPGSRKSALIW